ncbi:MAG: CtsR family transcriptional regulator [Firmicutes bacterium]|nr:CtsR family transcriptional regulator [Bacillota bacterium]MCL5038662.1 CtsR family transcriptional regulator [Bacillota bacterium]
MARLADIIERYIIERIDRSEDGFIEIQRSELAGRFQCVPSQINYVLETRFTPERGYLVESRRGGGGHIRITRLDTVSGEELLELVNEKIGDLVSQASAEGYIQRLWEGEIITEREARLMLAVVDRQVLPLDLPLRDILRANLLKAMLLTVLRQM